MALGTGNISSTQTALTDPSSLAPGSLGSDDLGSLLQSDDQIAGSGASTINTPALNGAIGSDFGSASSAVDSSAGSGISTDLGSILSSIAGSNLGTLAGYGGVYALLADQASSTQTQNNALAGQISAIGQPLVTEGQGLTSAFGQGQLTTPYQEQVTAAENANQNTATSQGQQVARLLANSGGGQNVQGAQASESQQITTAQTQANTNAISQAFQNELTSGLGLVGTGGQYVQSGIQQEISSNTALQGQLSNLMGTLAQAYARQTSGSGSGTPTGGLGSILSSLLGKGASVSPSSLTSGINADTSGNLTSLAGQTQPASASDASNFGNIDSNINADTLSNQASLDTSNLNNSSISLGDLVSNESDAGGVASDISDFSAGSAAAGTTLGSTAANLSDSDVASGIPSTDFSEVTNSLPSANFASDLSIAGDAGAVAGLVTDPTNPVNDIKAAGALGNVYQAATAGTGAASDTIGAITPYLGLAGAAAGMALSDYQLLDPANTPDSITSMPAGASIGKLPSGNSLLEDGSIGVGAGTQQTAGSGEIYNTVSGTPQWIGQADSGALEQDYDNYEAAASGKTTGEAQSTYDAANTKTATTGLGTSITTTPTGLSAQAGAASATGQLTPTEQATDEKSAESSMASIYNSLGGEKYWGVSQQAWMESLMSSLGSFSQGTEWART
jgi:hypothetical protein